MDASELLRIVDTIHRDKKIDKEVVLGSIESALISAAKKYYDDDSEIHVHIDRDSGLIVGERNGVLMAPEEIAQRIGAQTAKQVMIQKIREAERDTIFNDFKSQLDTMVTGTVHKMERGTAIVNIPGIEAILPSSEMIPRESIKVGDHIRATIAEVRKQGSRVKVVLSRTRTHLVRHLFEENIPEISEGIIEIKAISREPGYRSKVAVRSDDQRIDSQGACIGVRGSRIKAIKDDLAGEQIDIVLWDDDPLKLIPNALQPAEIEETILCQILGRAIVLVNESQLSLAIGKRGQNVRLASKLCGWDIEIMTSDELQENLEKAVVGFGSIPGVTPELADMLVGEGFLTYDDLSIIEPDLLQEMGKFSEEMALSITDEAERRADASEQAFAYEKTGSGNSNYSESFSASVSEPREETDSSAEAELIATMENVAEATEDAETTAEPEEATEDAEATAEPEEATEDAEATAEPEATEEKSAEAE